jgi:hypothetical protein
MKIILEFIYKEKLKAVKIEARGFYDDWRVT